MATRQRAALRPPTLAPQAAQSSPAGGSRPAPSRAGKRGVTFYLPEAEWKALRRLSVDADATIQDLMEQAVGALLAGKAAKKAAS